MGLTSASTGKNAASTGIAGLRKRDGELVIALAGNPNVGKSTLFNRLTGMNQHTGNWAGKTVTNAAGRCVSGKNAYVMVDIPGTYSLMAHSEEEKVARDFICFGGADAVVVVCDAACLDRNMNLVLQTMEICPRVLVCVNLLDEAKRKGVEIDLDGLSCCLGVPVIGIVAREKGSREAVLQALDALMDAPAGETVRIHYPEEVERAILPVQDALPDCGSLPRRWLSLRILEGDGELISSVNTYLGGALHRGGAVAEAERQRQALFPDADALKDAVVTAITRTGELVCADTVRTQRHSTAADRRIDRLVTGRLLGYPLMLLLLAAVFYLTIKGANYPSKWLAGVLFVFQDKLTELFTLWKAPDWLHGVVVLGAYRVLAWVVSVMLPPMAIFFPLFTLLEDVGYLPRVAYNLDKPFRCCKACGKQSLSMCMGLGCNAAGVVGCRIIDSPRERLLAVLTNSFMPCNGRFPTLIALLTMFFAVGGGGAAIPALLLTGLIVLSVCVTFGVTKLLSETLLKGLPSSFVIELPPYRLPQVGKVIVRSVFDRTLFVLGRAAAVAAPAGAILWLLANVTAGGESLLSLCAGALDPIGRLMGMDGVILTAFILGFPANEIVFPIIIMAYTAQGSLSGVGELWEIKELLLQNGWTSVTALCVILFSLMHWPCSTTLLTIGKETGSLKWALLSALVPTAVGFLCCVLVNIISKLF